MRYLNLLFLIFVCPLFSFGQFQAVTDTAFTDENTSVTVNVIQNDGIQADASFLSIVDAPSNGVASSNTTTGEITYVPNTDFNGVDTLVYSIATNSKYDTSIVLSSPNHTCSCAPENTFNVSGGNITTAIGTHTLGSNGSRTATSQELCIVASGGGTAIVTGTVYMNGGDLYLCSTDGTQIDFRPTLSGQWNTSGGTVHQYANVLLNSNRDIEGFTWNIEQGTLSASNIMVESDINDNTLGQLSVKENTLLEANDINISRSAYFINHGAATITGSTSSGDILSSLENHGRMTVNGDLTRTYGTTKNYGDIIVTGTLKLGGGNNSNIDLSNGVFYAQDLIITSGIFNADADKAALLYVNNTVYINCGSSYPNANIHIIDETLDAGDSPCNAEKNDGSHFTYTDLENAPVSAKNLMKGEVDTAYVFITVNSTTIDSTVYIPSGTFRAMIKKLDLNKDGFIQKSEAEALSAPLNLDGNVVFAATGQKINDFTGIEAFVNITQLNISNNEITTLDLSSNTALTEINCDNNNLTSLNVSNLLGLTELICNDNELTSLDVSSNTSLRKLICHNNNLTSLDVSSNTSLKTLNCSHNDLGQLNTTNAADLEVLNCSYNELVTLDVTTHTSVKYLYVNNNTSLSTLLLNGADDTNLLRLYVQNTALSGTLDISQFKSLQKVKTGNTSLTSLIVSKDAPVTTYLTTYAAYFASVSPSQVRVDLDSSINSGYYVIKAYNLQGKEVNPNTQGEVIILQYNDGSTEKVLND